MLTLNNYLADALCVVIACGFIDDMNPVKGTATNNYTEFINGGPAKEDIYNDLTKKLSEFGISITFCAPPNKDKTPFIMGKTRNLLPQTAFGIQEDMKSWANVLEGIVNRYGNNLYGAYLGGFTNISNVEVIGVSDLYLYSPKYRTNLATEEPVKKSYDAAKNVTNAVIEHLKKLPSYPKSVKCKKENLKEITDSYEENSLFASVHGMTRAITYAPSFSDPNQVHFELALGKDTNKVASCIPCSLFMKAMGNPATYTHLGRGDNWNLPQNCDAYCKEKWTKYIIDCYRKGKEKLEKEPHLEEWFQMSKDLEIKLIPDVFLESLTYESSFIDKFKNILKF